MKWLHVVVLFVNNVLPVVFIKLLYLEGNFLRRVSSLIYIFFDPFEFATVIIFEIILNICTFQPFVFETSDMK